MVQLELQFSKPREGDANDGIAISFCGAKLAIVVDHEQKRNANCIKVLAARKRKRRPPENIGNFQRAPNVIIYVSIECPIGALWI